MEKVYDICCGIDVHKKLTVACLRNGRKQEIRQSRTFTRSMREFVRIASKNALIWRQPTPS